MHPSCLVTDGGNPHFLPSPSPPSRSRRCYHDARREACLQSVYFPLPAIICFYWQHPRSAFLITPIHLLRSIASEGRPDSAVDSASVLRSRLDISISRLTFLCDSSFTRQTFRAFPFTILRLIHSKQLPSAGSALLANKPHQPTNTNACRFCIGAFGGHSVWVSTEIPRCGLDCMRIHILCRLCLRGEIYGNFSVKKEARNTHAERPRFDKDSPDSPKSTHKVKNVSFIVINKQIIIIKNNAIRCARN